MRQYAYAVALSVLGGSAALAADLPPPVATPRAPAVYVPVAAPFSWTGIYIGVNGSGFLVGGTIGGNYQIGSFVIGIEGDGDWADINGTTNNSCAPGCETKS